VAKCRNQGANSGPSTIEGFDQAIEASGVELVPLWRNFCGNAPNLIDIYFFSACESRLERIPARHMVVHTVPGVDTTQRRIRKIPLAGIETIPLVNERRLVCRSPLRLAAEYCLTPICIARPFIEHDRSREFFEIRDLL
jgi:hypothetical protein